MKTTFFLSKPLREIGHTIAQYWFFIFVRRHHEQWINCFIASQWNIQNQVYNFNKISNSLSRKKWEWFRRIATNANQERQHIVESLQSSRPSFIFHSIHVCQLLSKRQACKLLNTFLHYKDWHLNILPFIASHPLKEFK